MNYLHQIAKKLSIRVLDNNLSEHINAHIDDIDLNASEEILIYIKGKPKSLIRIKDGKFVIYGDEKDEDHLRRFSGLFISLLGWDEHAFPIEQSRLISYMGRLHEFDALPNRTRENSFSSTDPAFTIKVTSGTRTNNSSADKNSPNPKDAFSDSAATQQDQLQKRAGVWKSRGLKKVEVYDDSVWISLKENVVIEDREEELKLYGNYDLQAISLMISHAKEVWENQCYINSDDDQFKILVWRECYLQGVELKNYEPGVKEKRRILDSIRASKSNSRSAPQPAAA
jgi:hypothetical protein